MNRVQFQSWLDDYVAAWKTYDPARIGALFAADCTYRYSPDADGLRGRDAIVAAWLDNKDEPGTYDAHYEPLAIDGAVHVASGWTHYFDAAGEKRDEYHNVYVCRFDERAQCTDFTEYWMQGNEFRKRAREELIRKAKSGEVG